MIRHLTSLGVLLALVFTLVVPGQGQEPAEKNPADPAVEKDKGEKDKGEKDKGDKDKAGKTDKPFDPTKILIPPPPPPNPWVKVGEIVAKVRGVQDSDRSLQVSIQVPQLNQGAVQGLAQAQLELARAQAQPGQNQQQAIFNALQNMQRHKANMYTTRWEDQTVKLHDEVKIRIAQPPQKFDDKGRLVSMYTAAQLKEMKGPDPSLPGYMAEMSDLAAGQIVKLTLVKHRDQMKARPPVRPMAKGLENLDADQLLGDNKPQASVVLIVGSAPAGQ